MEISKFKFSRPAELDVSIIIVSFNTREILLRCLESIKKQNGHFGMEIVWINDGSNELSTKLLEKTLIEFEKTMRFTKIIYLDIRIGL